MEVFAGKLIFINLFFMLDILSVLVYYLASTVVRREAFEFKSNLPIYLQVIDDIKKKIITGALPLGTKLPSSRELAIQYDINPNTAARVYNEMESLELSYTKRGIGTFVTEDPQVIDRLKQEQLKQILTVLDEQLTGMGYTPTEIIRLLQDYYSL